MHVSSAASIALVTTLRRSIGEACADQLEHLAGDLRLALAAFETDQGVEHLFGIARRGIHRDEPARLLAGVRLGRDQIEADESILIDKTGEKFGRREVAMKSRKSGRSH